MLTFHLLVGFRPSLFLGERPGSLSKALLLGLRNRGRRREQRNVYQALDAARWQDDVRRTPRANGCRLRRPSEDRGPQTKPGMTSLSVYILIHTLMVVMSFFIYSFLVRVCPAKNRLSRAPRAPPDLTRPRDRATPTPHVSPPCHRRNIGCRSPTRRAGGVERCPPGDGLLYPRDGGDHKKWNSRYDTAKLAEYCTHALLYICCTAVHGGWVSEWVDGCVGG